ncbi:elongation factor G [Striga asiatica]|uniref:Elongation factor G n=1 Tax=Striga asiatica TaxID=4170 RepID=A0A5A7R633_STRAF|nr:elongation factor G [Striga asiatica]
MWMTSLLKHPVHRNLYQLPNLRYGIVIYPSKAKKHLHYFVPMFVGSALKNKSEKTVFILNFCYGVVVLSGSQAGPLVALAFKLEEGRFGQLTYLRVYECSIHNDDLMINMNTG